MLFSNLISLLRNGFTRALLRNVAVGYAVIGFVLFAHRIALERDLVGLMHETIENGVCKRWILQPRVPVFEGQL